MRRRDVMDGSCDEGDPAREGRRGQHARHERQSPVRSSDLRFEDVADAVGAVSDASGVCALEAYPDDFLNDMPRDRVPDKLKGILASSGRSTGADAQIYNVLVPSRISLLT